MKIYLSSIRQYSKLLLLVTGKGNRYTECLYIDFPNKMMGFKNSYHYGNFSFEWEPEEGDIVTEEANVYVNAEKMVALASVYDILTLSLDSFIFTNPMNKSEKFSLGMWKETVEDEEKNFIPTLVEIPPHFSSFQLSEKTALSLKEAVEYTDESFKSILIQDSFLCATASGKKFYEAHIDQHFSNLSLHKDTVRFIISALSFSSTASIRLYNSPDEKWTGLQINNSFFMHCAKILDTGIPDVRSEGFITSYDHPTFFVIDTKEFVSVIRFLESFSKSAEYQRVSFKVINDGKEVAFEILDNDMIVRVVPLLECSEELKGSSIPMNMMIVKQVIGTFHSSQKIRVQVSMHDSKPAVNFSATYSEEETKQPEFVERHVVVPRLERYENKEKASLYN